MEFTVLNSPKGFWRSLPEILLFSLFSWSKHRKTWLPTQPLELMPFPFAFAWLMPCTQLDILRRSCPHHGLDRWMVDETWSLSRQGGLWVYPTSCWNLRTPLSVFLPSLQNPQTASNNSTCDIGMWEPSTLDWPLDWRAITANSDFQASIFQVVLHSQGRTDHLELTTERRSIYSWCCQHVYQHRHRPRS